MIALKGDRSQNTPKILFPRLFNMLVSYYCKWLFFGVSGFPLNV